MSLDLFHVLSVVITYTASPELAASALQHGIHVDELPLSDGDEPAVSRVVILQRTSDHDGVCRLKNTMRTDEIKSSGGLTGTFSDRAFGPTLGGSTHGCSRRQHTASFWRVRPSACLLHRPTAGGRVKEQARVWRPCLCGSTGASEF